ncbi:MULTISPECIES: F0F1 ATP synthase subunit B [Rhizobium]|uniref:ATP synthase subunit b n=1 Tax=Rhizobium rhododendri TaxID=2506430 RepID=A0ABY8IJT9_9HYPH|nr:MULTISPECIES: F0F1 ATP synthase subunit B [Rhizobium]MBZ5760539.1 F0F1 ATP synthase subunit B [Rhizobium sp. VS19-DR96]MBZ5766617.1 F0F1 ATP synthase subunit B [Rhizobium sp. VS19-DR129.2]MBZ5773390.1 F0F1 ATP synthase subunit B [Rhizobium sp. VS19-DRK62.2]MBZ5784374.1 F0F1 ATP synthase subunit B [Rhizobium sp. VS19-DR121]MBZ5802734.1 F0F1 ATP synthase subunit B [Rhizobium sp. VS19-DR181]
MFVTPAYAEEAAPAPGEVHTETGVAPGHHASFPPFDPKTFPSALLWLVITFAIFYIVMQKVLVPRVGGILESRHARIAQDVEEAARLKAEADAAVATYERELAEARAKSNAIGAAARAEAKAKAEAERRAIEASLAEKIKTAEARIAEIKAKAFADVGAVAEEAASSVVEQLIGMPASQSEVAAAVANVKQEA